MPNLERIWEYFRTIAEVTGRDEKGEKQNYSLEFFFEQIQPENFSLLMKAFFGDETAMQTLEFSNPLPSTAQILRDSSQKTPPYEAQCKAIAHAMADSVSLIQGPPGTGKTEMILNLLSCIRKQYPTAKVAVVSSNNEAIQNITDKIAEGSDEMTKELQKSYAPLGAKSKRTAFREALQFQNRDTSFFRKEDKIAPSLFLQYPIFSSTIHSLRKIFTPDFHNEFDYVIMDECSQIGILLGLIAMSCAKHLVLIGDKEQLAPVYINKLIDPVNEQFKDVEDVFKEHEEKSFLSVCETIFKGNIHPIMLDSHFRCHPSIIEFCNRYIYDNQLKIMTKRNDTQFAIRVLWYEGDYYERGKKVYLEEQKQYENDILNWKQIKIFIQEEWEDLKERMLKNPHMSVCILSPYKKQLRILQKELLSMPDVKEFMKEIHLESESQFTETLPQLTIHSSQGRGYDVVYLMPVEDCSYDRMWAWSQRRRMINVAVSRAKKELRVITSSQWLPESIQQEYTGHILKLRKPDDPEEEKNQLFVKKLMDYIAECNVNDPIFGFHRSEIESVFDSVPWYRQEHRIDENSSAPERCMLNALREEFPEYQIYREFPLSYLTKNAEIPQSEEFSEEDLQKYRELARIDIVICDKNRVLMAIEVDGAHHRMENETIMQNDARKDLWMKAVENLKFSRYPTNGTTSDEMEQIRSEISSVDGMEIDAQDIQKQKAEEQKRKLAEYYHNFITHNLKQVQSHITEEGQNLEMDAKLLRVIQSLNYIKPTSLNADYSDALTDAYYFTRYGMAYAFEYVMLHEAVFRIAMHRTNTLYHGVYSFGCGSLMDAWSMAYAKCKLIRQNPQYENMKMIYRGIDLSQWKEFVIQPPHCGKRSTENFSELFERRICFVQMGADKYLESCAGTLNYDTLFFPKILNELNDTIVDSIAQALEKIPLNPRAQEYYLCISHSKTKAEDDMKKVEKIINALRKNAEQNGFTFEVQDDLQQILGEEYQEWLADYTLPDAQPICNTVGNLHYYTFTDYESHFLDENGKPRRETRKIADMPEIGNDFSHSENDEYFSRHRISEMEKSYRKAFNTSGVRSPITRVGLIAFQIVRLVKNS
ncbi:MAG TPA: hypothetical protein DCO72_01465 [Ruminococcus sp.]|nr:hypothetical protein [Ruminococcus sp.]